MKCDDVQKALSAGALEEGPRWQKWLLRRHLHACTDCQTALSEMQWLASQMPRWRSDEPSPQLEVRIIEALALAPLSTETPSPPQPASSGSLLYRIGKLKEDPIMKRRLAFSLVLILAISTSLLSGSHWQASAVTRLHNMKKAMQSVHNAYVSTWEKGLLPGGKFYVRELWVQGDVLKIHIKGELWQISTRDTNWNYIPPDDRLVRMAHKQAPVTFDFSSTLRDIKGFQKDGMGVRVESGDDTVMNGRPVAVIQITQTVPSQEEIEQDKLKLPLSHSRRSLYWVDKTTDLPLHSEEYEEQNGQWVLVSRADYAYNLPLPTNFFDPQELLREGRRETGRHTNKP